MKMTPTADGGAMIAVKEGVFALSSTEGPEVLFRTNKEGSGRSLTLPGEWELGNVLIKGMYTDHRKNVVYKATAGGETVVDFGTLKEIPKSDFFEELGEQVTLAIVRITDDFDAKKANILLGELTPPFTLIIGPVTAMAGLNAKPKEDTWKLPAGYSVEGQERFYFAV